MKDLKFKEPCYSLRDEVKRWPDKEKGKEI